MSQLGLPPSRIDLLTSVPGLEFESCWTNREQAQVGNLSVPMIGLDDLIDAKKHAAREQDLLDLAKLTDARNAKDVGD